MRIYIKTEEGKRIRIPMPLWVVILVTRLPIEKIARKHIGERDAKWIDAIDWMELRSLISSLSEYKGLNLVDVKTNDGTEVLIEI